MAALMAGSAVETPLARIQAATCLPLVVSRLQGAVVGRGGGVLGVVISLVGLALGCLLGQAGVAEEQMNDSKKGETASGEKPSAAGKHSGSDVAWRMWPGASQQSSGRPRPAEPWHQRSTSVADRHATIKWCWKLLHR